MNPWLLLCIGSAIVAALGLAVLAARAAGRKL